MSVSIRTRIVEVRYSQHKSTFLRRLASRHSVGRWMQTRDGHTRSLLDAAGAARLWTLLGTAGFRDGQTLRLRVTYVYERKGIHVFQLLLEPVIERSTPSMEQRARDAARRFLEEGTPDMQRERVRRWQRLIWERFRAVRHAPPGGGFWQDRAGAAERVVPDLEGYRDFWREHARRGIVLSRRAHPSAEQGRQRAMNLYRAFANEPAWLRRRVLLNENGARLLQRMDDEIEAQRRRYQGDPEGARYERGQRLVREAEDRQRTRAH